MMTVETESQGQNRIVVGVATFKRNELLKKCLASIENSIFPEDVEITIAVCDNTSEKNAMSVVESVRKSSVVKINYLHEPRRGISEARNKIIDFAIEGGASFLAFIDDDEYVEKNWIDELWSAIKKSDADIVRGPVRYFYTEKDKEVTIQVTHKEEGKRIKDVATNNVIFSRRIFFDLGLRFDPEFSLTGGGDSDYFRRAMALGAIARWTNSALVNAYEPPSRLTLKYKLLRSFRVGSATTKSKIKTKGAKAYISETKKMLQRVLGGLLALLLTPLKLFKSNKEAQCSAVNALQKIADGMGRIGGMFGLNIRMYK